MITNIKSFSLVYIMARTSITLADNEWEVIRDFCKVNDVKVSGFLRKCALDKIKTMEGNNDRY